MPLSVSEAVTATIQNRSKDVADNFMNNTALMKKLNARGNKKKLGGGTSIYRPISYQENGTFKYFQDYETLDNTPSDVLTSVDYEWKSAAVAITASGRDLRVNAGPEAQLDLWAERIKVGEKTLIKNLSAGVYSDGTGSSGKEITGLQAQIADDGTGTVGGINSSTYTWWKNYFYDFSDKSITSSATTIEAALDEAINNLTRGADRPDLIVMDNTYFGYLQAALKSNQRYVNYSDKLLAGFQALEYNGIPVILDGGKDGDAPSSHVYLINTEYMELCVHKDLDMAPLMGGDRFPVNQDAKVHFIGWEGNLVCNNRALQGTIVE